MSGSIDIAPGQQRLFQDRAGRCVLLHTAGIAVSFIMDENGAARVVERIEGIDFKATGSHLPCICGNLDHRAAAVSDSPKLFFKGTEIFKEAFSANHSR